MPWDDVKESTSTTSTKLESNTDEEIKPLIKELTDETGTPTGYTMEVADVASDEKLSSPPKKKFRRGMIKEAPYIFLDDNDEELSAIRKFYTVSSELPSSQFLIRDNEGKMRHMYLVSEDIQKIISMNPNLKIINTGLRVFSRSAFDAGAKENAVSYRLVQDGSHLMSNYIKERKVPITHKDLVALLIHGETSTDNLDINTKECLQNITMGCVLWKYLPAAITEDGSENQLTAEIWLCGHYGTKVVQCMVTKEEKKHFLRLLGVPIPDEMDVKVKGPSWGDTNDDKEEATTNQDDLTTTNGVNDVKKNEMDE